MGLFRRRHETYNEQMLREAGLDPAQFLGDTVTAAPEPDLAPPPRFKNAYDITSADIAKEWDATVTATAPGLEGDRIEFTALPDGDLLVGEEHGDANLSDLADAVETKLPPPYRAAASRQGGDLWGVGAKRIEVEKLEWADADVLELSRKDSWQELRVDGEPTTARAPALERLGERAGPDFFVKAERLDGDLWEVRASAL